MITVYITRPNEQDNNTSDYMIYLKEDAVDGYFFNTLNNYSREIRSDKTAIKKAKEYIVDSIERYYTFTIGSTKLEGLELLEQDIKDEKVFIGFNE